MSGTKLSFLLFIPTMAIFMLSCNKPDNNTPIINSPLVVITPSSDSAFAGDKVAFDYTATAVNGIKRIQISTQFLQNQKVTAMDSTLSSTRPAIDLNFIYTMPDTAVRGQQAFVTFVITDGKGNATTKTATATVTGSRPRVSAVPSTTSASVGDTVSFTVTIKSPDKNIQTLDVSQIINNASSTSLPSVPFSGTNETETTIYKYGIPSSSKSGDMIDLLFTAVNTSGVTNFTNATITVK